MKLSEAIILGEFALKPTNGNWFERNVGGQVCAGCAMGRTCVAAGYSPLMITATTYRDEPVAMSRFMEAQWPWVSQARPDIKGKVDGHYFWVDASETVNCVFAAISNLYEGGWSMRQIADWVATIEPQETIEPADVPAVEPVEALEAAC